jgi:hypothetical protein
MSFARFGPESDVYVFPHVDGHFECSMCALGDTSVFRSKDAAEFVAHLEDHRKAGHKVPEWTAKDVLAYKWPEPEGGVMANNRLYILDTERNEAFPLVKALGDGWYCYHKRQATLGDDLTEWLDNTDEGVPRDLSASIGGTPTKLVLVDENHHDLTGVKIWIKKEE